MKDYKFDSLNDKEFEALCISLLSKREKVFIERFKTGKDDGIDGRFYKNANSDAIIQRKHWIGSGLPSLLRHLEDYELKKVIKLKPSRYILSTSLPLSPSNKQKIASIFKLFIKTQSDILGKDDLNSLISQYPEVEKEHIKLWFSSPSLLEYLLNNATYNVSRESIKTITQKAKIYVNTANHIKALEKLDKLHTIIITGEPGIGKTTLAEQLCLHYLNQKYELVCIDDSLREAENVYQEKKHQVFYFDDFLGSNYLEGLRSKEDSKTTRFIKKVSRLDNKRFILTSRTSILNQGKQYSQTFRSDNIDRNEFELCVDSLTYFDKAQILYNHIWYGSLSESLVDEFYHERRYHEVIRHRNFNPRIIQFITDAEKIVNSEISSYWPYVIKSLENPADIWDHAYTAQLDSLDRTLVDLVAFNGAPISETDLSRAYDECIRYKGLARHYRAPSDFLSCAKSVCRSFINRQHSINVERLHMFLLIHQ